MRIHRFYLENIDYSGDNKSLVTQETSLIHQLKNVFRYKPGQTIYIFNEKVGEIEVEIINMNKKDMSFKYIRHAKKISNDVSSKRQVILYMSVIKNSNFDLIVEKAVEIGVNQIIPITTERTIKNNLNEERLNKIIKEATEQCGRMDLLNLHKVSSFIEAIDLVRNNKEDAYFGSIENDATSIIDKKSDKNVSLFIGPEGGFSEEETKMLLENKIKPISLGKNILRAETAAILGCGIISL